MDPELFSIHKKEGDYNEERELRGGGDGGSNDSTNSEGAK